MTTTVQARDALVALVESTLRVDRPAVPVFYENTLSVDMDTVNFPFIRCEIDFDDAMFITMDAEHAHYGSMYLTIFYSPGTGIRSSFDLFDYVCANFKNVRASGVVTAMPRMSKKDERNGVPFIEILVPFRLFSLTA